ncbi:MAG: heme biosynthesis protein HemY [Alphaproteobacteria bacterium]
MTRLIAILIAAGIAAAFMAWLAGLEGGLQLTVAGYEFRMSVGVAAGILILVIASAVILHRVVVAIWGVPDRFGVWYSARRARQGYRALSDGLVAAAAGDAHEALRLARRTEKLLGSPPLALLLTAQAAQLAGDEQKQSSSYRAMLDHADTEFLGLRGLFMEARKRGDDAQALALAGRAHQLRPKAAWAANALFDLKCAKGLWREAQKVLEEAARARLLDSDVARRRRAVLLTAEALEAEKNGEGERALSRALEALALSPALAPAAALAARRLSAAGRIWKAQDAIEAAWAQSPHPDLAVAYADIRPEEETPARAKRLMGLARLNRGHFESRLLEAEQAIALKRWSQARAALHPLAQSFTTARVCALMAEIAQEERGDMVAAHGWLARAVRAPRDAQWICNSCGWASSEWRAVCGACGAFDSLAWTTPGAGVLEKMPHIEVEEPQEETSVAGPVVIEGVARPAPAYAPREIGAESLRRDDIVLPRPPDDPGPGADSEGEDAYESAGSKEDAARLRRGGRIRA